MATKNVLDLSNALLHCELCKMYSLSQVLYNAYLTKSMAYF